MIYGTVNAWSEATVELAVRGPEGREERLEFLVDTGFDGDLTLHSAVVAELGLQKVGESSAILADGSANFVRHVQRGRVLGRRAAEGVDPDR